MKIKYLITDLEVLALGWEKFALDHKFSGYSLEQLRALIQSLKELLVAMDALKLEFRGKIAARQSMGRICMIFGFALSIASAVMRISVKIPSSIDISDSRRVRRGRVGGPARRRAAMKPIRKIRLRRIPRATIRRLNAPS